MEASLPIETKDRITLLDGIRGIALCGILLMNINMFARPVTAMFNLTVLNETSPPDIITWALQSTIVEGSFRGLFSLLFGAGTLLIITRLERSSGLNAAETVNEGNRPQTVHLAIDHSNAPYVITKPFHHTQKIVTKSSQGIEITIDVVLNYELEREILGFGECITVIKPKKLRERIESNLKKAVEKYQIIPATEE